MMMRLKFYLNLFSITLIDLTNHLISIINTCLHMIYHLLLIKDLSFLYQQKNNNQPSQYTRQFQSVFIRKAANSVQVLLELSPLSLQIKEFMTVRIIQKPMKEHQAINQSLLDQTSASDLDPQKQAYLSNLPTIDGASFLQSAFFTWLHPFLKYSSKQGVRVDSMPILPKKLQTATEHQEVMKVWQGLPAGSSPGWKLIKALALKYKIDLIQLLILLLWAVCFYIIQPILTSINIDYIQNHRGDLTYGITLFLITVVIQIINKLTFNQLMYRFKFFGLKICNTINMMIYQKSLRYSTLADKKFSQAQIINYSQTDAQRMTYVGFQLSSLFYGPIQIIFAMIMMYFYVGISFLPGVSIIIVLIIFNFFVSKRINRLNEKVLKAKDQRIKVTEEMLDIIRFIKISAIEKFFFNKLEEKRRNQIDLYLKKGLTYCVVIVVFWLTTPLLLSATFLTFVALGGELTSEIAFTTIMLASIMEYPLHSLPTAVSQLIQMFVSIKRIQKFLVTEQIDSSLIVREVDTKYAVRIQNGNFFWGKQEKSDKEKEIMKKEKESKQNDLASKDSIQEKKSKKNQKEGDKKEKIIEKIHILKDINLTIQKGKFVMIIGDIGSGKSSLLQAILNQMIHHEDSKVYLSGQIAYSPQKPWIMSKTVKQNITFNLPYDLEKFNKVIYHSSFEHDLKILPQGAETQIGEKGINISGGQKARLSLARVLYSQNDICLLDDILSAVDVHVGDFLMKETLKGYLKGKTILMPTHALRYIEQADEIIIMKKGSIVQKGRFCDICNSPQYQQISEKEAQHEKQEKKDQEEIDVQAQLAMIKEVFQQKSYSHQKEVSKDKVSINNIIIQQLILPQDQEKGQVNWKIFRLFIKHSGGFSKFVIPILLSMFCWITCKTLSSIFLEKGCEDPSQNSQELILFIVFIMLSNVFIFVRTITMAVSSAKQGKYVHDEMIKSLLYASLSNFFNRVPVGRVVNRLTKDLREIDEDIVDAMSWLVVSFFELLSTLVICIYASSVFAIIPMIIIGLISNQFRKYYMKTQRQLTRYQKSTNSPVLSGFMSTISGLSSIRAYKVQQKFMEAQSKSTDTNKRVRLSKSGLQNWFCNILSLLSFMVNMPCIAYCMFSNSSNPSLVGLLMVYALALCQNMTNISLSSAYFETKLVSLERIYTFMSIQPEEDYKRYCEDWQAQQEGGKQVFESGSLEFSGLSASYRKDLPNVLKRITCKIQAGEKVGIVGRTGAGKSTIINTLLRITNISNGKILIDDKDIVDFQLKNLRFSITMIDQEPTLIKSTFRENLDITNRYSDEQLQSILRECNLLEVINDKGGLSGMVSNSSLSAGEKQLLCICRAFLKQSKIVLIDEATANIDVKNDTIIQKVIAEKFKNSTVLTIAHRLSTLKNADKIMVLEKGELIEFGEPGELQRREGGFYAEMIKKNSAELLS